MKPTGLPKTGTFIFLTRFARFSLHLPKCQEDVQVCRINGYVLGEALGVGDYREGGVGAFGDTVRGKLRLGMVEDLF